VDVRCYIDPETDQPHIYRHAVDEEEVEEVLRRAMEDRPGREGSRVAVGRTEEGRYLRVVHVPDPAPDAVFVITPINSARKRCRHFDVGAGGGYEPGKVSPRLGRGARPPRS
jgi:hypothetical protein